MKMKLLYAALILLTSQAAKAQFNGERDSTFGTNGEATLNLFNQNNEFVAVRYGTDGKIYAAGNTSVGNTVNIFLARFLASGDIDLNFGNNGKVLFDPTLGGNAYVTDIQLDANNKIIIVGYAYASQQLKYQYLVARFLSNGDQDFSFNQTSTILGGGNFDDAFFSCHLETNGKIIAVGATSDGDGSNLTAMRFNANGSTDVGYGFNGQAIFDYASLEYFYTIHKQSNNLYYLVAQVSDVSRVMALDGTGNLINTFGTNGSVVLNMLNGFEINANKIKTSGNNVFVVGHAKNTQTNKLDVFVAKMNNTGVLQNNFAINGIFRADIAATKNDMATDIHFLANGTLLMSGNVQDAGNNIQMMNFMLASDGSLISGYGTNGLQTYPIQGSNDGTNVGMATDANGKILMFGKVSSGQNTIGALVKLKTTQSTVGMDDYISANDFRVFPTPAKDQLFVFLPNSPGAIHFGLWNINGQMVAEIQQAPLAENRYNISILIENLPEGVYILRVGNQHINLNQKIIIAR